MAQIVQGTNWAEQLGTGLGSGLQALAQNKINQLKQRHGLGAVGYTPEQADQLSYLDPQILNQIVKQKLQEPTQEGYAQLVQALLGGEQQAPLSEAENFSMGQRGVSPQQQAPQMPGLANLFPQAFRQPQIQAQEQQKPQVQPATLTPNQEAQLLKRQQAGLPIPKRLTEKQANTLLKLGMQQQALGKKEQQEARRLEHKEQVEATKETKKYYDEVLKAEKSAKEADLRLNKMEELIKKGNLPWPSYYNLLKNLEEKISPATGAATGATIGGLIGAAGGPAAIPAAATGAALGGALGGLLNPVVGLLRSAQKVTSPDLEQFEKLSADFVKNAKDFFPGRVTNADLEAFFRSIPTLSQTDAGKKAIIQNMKSFNEAALLRAQALKQIIKENKGMRPGDLPLLVEEKIGPELDKLAKKFISQ